MQIKQLFTLALCAGSLWLGAASAQAQAGRQQLAIDILSNGQITLYTGFGTANSHSLANMQDTADCQPAHTSSYSDVGDTQVWLHTGMLQAMKTLATTYGYSFRVTAISGGDHSSGSYHYRGTAFDVDLINGVQVSAGAAYWQTFLNRCQSMGAVELLGPGDAGHDTHIHAAWPSGTSASSAGGCLPPLLVTPSIVTRTDGKVTAFVVNAADGSVSYREKSGVAGAWGSWVSLGGSGFRFIRALAIDNGGVAVFGMGGGNIYYKYLASSGSGVWSGWVSIPASGFSSIAPIMKTDGKMAVTGCGNNTTIFYIEQTGTGPAGAWPANWQNLTASSFWEVDSVALTNGGAAVFGVGSGSGVYYKYKTTGAGAWSSWVNLGGSGFSHISAVKETGGKLAFFGCGAGVGSAIFYQEQTAVGAASGWTGWTSLSGSGFSSISGVALPNNGLAVFACTDNGSGSSEFYKVRTSATAAWSGFVDLGATSVRRVSATADSAGLMTTLMRGGTGGTLWERRQTDATHWAAWVNLGGNLQ